MLAESRSNQRGQARMQVQRDVGTRHAKIEFGLRIGLRIAEAGDDLEMANNAEDEAAIDIARVEERELIPGAGFEMGRERVTQADQHFSSRRTTALISGRASIDLDDEVGQARGGMIAVVVTVAAMIVVAIVAVFVVRMAGMT